MTEQCRAVAQMHAAGRAHREIAASLGITYPTVCREIVNGRKLGIVPPRPPANPRTQIATKMKALDISKGYIIDTLEELTEDELDWLLSSAARGGYETVAEFLTDTVRTAYDTEQEEKKSDR